MNKNKLVFLFVLQTILVCCCLQPSVNAEPSNKYCSPREIIEDIKQNIDEYNRRINSLIAFSGYPIEKAQLELYVTPDNFWTTFVWSNSTLKVYDGVIEG